MNMDYEVKKLQEKIKGYVEEYTAKAEAWEKVIIKRKKDGTDFANLNQSFDGASIGKYTPVEDKKHPYLTVSYSTPRWGSDSIQIFVYCDEEDKSYKNKSFVRDTRILTVDEIEQKIKDHITYCKEQAKIYTNDLPKIEKAMTDYAEAVKTAQEKLKSIGSDSLFYGVRDAVNKSYLV